MPRPEPNRQMPITKTFRDVWAGMAGALHLERARHPYASAYCHFVYLLVMLPGLRSPLLFYSSPTHLSLHPSLSPRSQHSIPPKICQPR